jgi:hypothetical protein
MSKPDRKQRREAKRKAKRVAARRRDSVSPVKRLAEAPGEVECWMSDGFETMGQLQIFAYKRAGGLAGMACFLIDRGVVGLKDAWTRMNVDRAEFDEMLDLSAQQGLLMNPIGVEVARRWVAGGARWAHDNGMRLPNKWTKPASLIGGVGDWASADVSAFVKEFAGHPDDLRQRLIAESLESYLARTDIAFDLNDTAPYKDQRTGRYVNPGEFLDFDDEDDDGDGDADEELSDEEIEAIADDLPMEELNALAERFTPAAQALATRTTTWLAGRGDAPSPELLDAWRSVMLAAMISRSAMPDAPEEDIADFGFEMLRDVSRRLDESRFAAHQQAVGQVLEHLQTNTRMMEEAVLDYGLA